VAQELHTALIETPHCPDNMVEIDGDYCPENKLTQNCLKLDKTVHNVNGYVRCLEFAPSQCSASEEQLIHMHFCMDRFEWPNEKSIKPTVMISWNDMKKNCASENKRLCLDREWSLACEGPGILPYPYGYSRDVGACNIDHQQRPGFDASKATNSPEEVAYLDQRVPSGSMPKCVSPYGVYDMTGNVDESVINSSGHPYQSGLMGGHWVIGARNRCRPETIVHGPDTIFYEIGGRCCADISG
jgi:formylglycine-generating enzyme required for sulfatase activity